MNMRIVMLALIGLLVASVVACAGCIRQEAPSATPRRKATAVQITLFLCGDVMLGRGIDQVLPYPGDPVLYGLDMKSAKGYVELAEEANGPIPKPVDFSYVWGDALHELERLAPDARIVNLETSITPSNDYWKPKAIHYRMSPANIPCITAARIDCASLANNHILDWGYQGLIETLQALKKANVRNSGAGRNLREAETPAVIDVKGKGRVIVFSFGSTTSGIPSSWAASEDEPGVNLLTDFSEETARCIGEKVSEIKQQGDIVVASIHWGTNWAYEIPTEHIEFAHRLIDYAGVDVIHGHSSHHVKAIEVYKDKAILYGCGDFLNDYEGIDGHEAFRNNLGLMYFLSIDESTGKLIYMRMIPMEIKRFQVNRASKADAVWLQDILNREGKQFGTEVELNEEGVLTLRWQ